MEQTLGAVMQEKQGRICEVAPNATIEEAAKLMKNERVGALLVMQGSRITGIITERDIVYRVLATGADVATTHVHEVMSKDVVVVKPSLTIQDAMHVVTEKKFRHLPVVSEDRLVGVISSGDLTRRIVAEREDVIDALYDYMHGSYPG